LIEFFKTLRWKWLLWCIGYTLVVGVVMYVFGPEWAVPPLALLWMLYEG